MRVMATYRTRVEVGIVAVVLLCLLSTARFLMRPNVVDLALGRKITISEYENRFAGLRKVLPDHGVVGYLGNGDQNELPNYYLTQYALAPLVVDHSPEHEVVVGNFVSAVIPSQTAWPAKLVLVQDFGDGVVLFERRSR